MLETCGTTLSKENIIFRGLDKNSDKFIQLKCHKCKKVSEVKLTGYNTENSLYKCKNLVDKGKAYDLF